MATAKRKRTKQLNIRVTEGQLRQWTKAARVAKRVLSDWIRIMLDKEAAAEKK